MINLMEVNTDNILKDNNPILRQHSKEVDLKNDKSLENLVFKLKKYLYDSNDADIASEKNLVPAVGIAAVQIGILKRVFVMVDLEEEQFIEILNPKVINKSDTWAHLSGGEGCLSVPLKRDGDIHRSLEVEVEYYDLKGNKHNREFKGYQAIIFQHEYDHLEGKLYTDYLDGNINLEVEDSVEI